MFQVGERVVYPNHGVGEIEEENVFNFGGENVRFFTVRIVTSKSSVKVPANNAEAVGLRHLCTKEEIEGVFAYLRGPHVVRYDDWKERFKQNSDLMRTGKLTDMATVLKNLYLVSQVKPLSFREKRMYERAIQLITSEIAEVRKIPTHEVHESFEKIFANNEALKAEE